MLKSGRGGSWYYWPTNVRAAVRGWDIPANAGLFSGFRVRRRKRCEK